MPAAVVASELPPAHCQPRHSRHVVCFLRSSLSPRHEMAGRVQAGQWAVGWSLCPPGPPTPGPPVPAGLSLFPPLPVPATSVSLSVSPPFLSTPKRAVCKVCINAVFDICYSKEKKCELILVLLTRLFKAFAFV